VQGAVSPVASSMGGSWLPITQTPNVAGSAGSGALALPTSAFLAKVASIFVRTCRPGATVVDAPVCSGSGTYASGSSASCGSVTPSVDGSFTALTTTAYLPELVRGTRVLLKLEDGKFLVDNGQLNSRASGLQYRRSMKIDDRFEFYLAPFNSIVQGSLVDGWLKLELDPSNPIDGSLTEEGQHATYLVSTNGFTRGESADRGVHDLLHPIHNDCGCSEGTIVPSAPRGVTSLTGVQSGRGVVGDMTVAVRIVDREQNSRTTNGLRCSLKEHANEWEAHLYWNAPVGEDEVVAYRVVCLFTRACAEDKWTVSVRETCGSETRMTVRSLPLGRCEFCVSPVGSNGPSPVIIASGGLVVHDDLACSAAPEMHAVVNTTTLSALSAAFVPLFSSYRLGFDSTTSHIGAEPTTASDGCDTHREFRELESARRAAQAGCRKQCNTDNNEAVGSTILDTDVAVPLQAAREGADLRTQYVEIDSASECGAVNDDTTEEGKPSSVEPGDLVVLGPGVPSEHRGCHAVVTEVHESYCTVVVLDSTRSFGTGQCWPCFADISLESRGWRLGSHHAVTGLKGKKSRRLNGCMGIVARHPREGHPSFVRKDSAPEQPRLTLCLRFDDPVSAGATSMLLEPRFLNPKTQLIRQVTDDLMSFHDPDHRRIRPLDGTQVL